MSRTGKGVHIDGKKVPLKVIEPVWQKYHSDKPMPKIEVCCVEKRKFNKIAKWADTLEGAHSVELMTREHGRVLPPKRRAAFTFYHKNKHMHVIYYRSNTKRSLEEILNHEMQHIYDSIDDKGQYVGKSRKKNTQKQTSALTPNNKLHTTVAS